MIVMSLGLANVPAVFMNMMKMIFHPHADKSIVVFVDGFLIYLASEAKHKKHLRIAL